MLNIVLPNIVIAPDLIIQTGVQVGVALGAFLSQWMGQIGVT